MRSQNVFSAMKKVGNRYSLCRITAVSARNLHVAGTTFCESIDRSLKLLAETQPAATSAADEPAVEPHLADKRAIRVGVA